MHDILAATAPIYLLVALGYAARRLGAFDTADARVLGRYVINFALPALIFRAVGQRPIEALLSPGYLFAYAVGSVATVGVGVAVTLRAGGKLDEGAMHGMGMSCSNSGFVGYPVLVQVLGPVAGAALALNLVIENLLMGPLCLGLAQAARGEGGVGATLLATLRQMPKTRLLQAIAVAMAFSASGLALPPAASRAVELLANTSTGVALFVIGLSLHGEALRDKPGAILGVTAGKLLLHPLLVAGAFLVGPATDPALKLAGIGYAALPMLSIYPVLAQRFGLERFAAAVLVVAMTASFFTLSGLLAWMHAG
ncbi:AEC family transporter [Derxia gummosa]|uniref:AEC family transporter n=1 Tax=Derxia gummosa DSM 723 TaxID=1121388 RepID=A0A8B6X2T6_9BURK|nr:AEC family transporter [Derxia gummosa]